jgi:glucosamine--fructose-6-phosphate aminotransferase (isomerizing)
MDAGEVRRSDIPKRGGALLAVSQSGETKDVHRAVKIGEEFGVPRISVVNVVGSLIARSTGVGVYLNAGRENAVASTKAFTTQVTVLGLVALWFRQQKEQRENLTELPLKKEMLESLQRLPISFGMAMRSREKCKKIALELKDKRNMFILGKGYGEPIALEGALKIKEMAYIHAEGYSGGALKHGPFALIEGKEGSDGQTPVVIIILDDEHANLMRCAAEEVKARGARVYIITDNAKLAANIDDDPIVIPSNGVMTALIAVLPLQLIAYELAVLKGINPDTPRNLAKAVTTD